MSATPIHDHENKKQPMYCTLMKEICHDGWTESMGMGDPKTGKKPRCHKWVGIFVKKGIDAPMTEVFDCNEQWGTDLIQQVAQEVYQGAAATEQVRNRIVEANGVSRVIMSFIHQLAGALGYELALPQPPSRQNGLDGKQPPSLENGEKPN